MRKRPRAPRRAEKPAVRVERPAPPISEAVFLDIDGVLNSRATSAARRKGIVKTRMGPIDPVNVKALDALLEEAARQLGNPPSVVLSSAWRQSLSLQTIEAAMRRAGYRGRLADVTPRLGAGRGVEILSWLSEHSGVCAVVLDDEDFDLDCMEGRVVKTDFEKGLTPEDAAAAVEILVRARRADDERHANDSYGAEDLIRAYIEKRRYAGKADDFEGYHQAKYRCLSDFLGVDFDAEAEPFSADATRLSLFRHTVETMLEVHSPFSRYLEFPRELIEVRDRHEKPIEEAEGLLWKAEFALLEGLFRAVYGARTERISYREMMRRGVNPTAGPDPTDYW